MYSVKRHEVLRVLPAHHKTSVRNLCYFKDFGHMVLSAGNEKDILVWSVENMITDPLCGRIIGHKNPVVDLRSFF